jgi:DNA-binding CsgD family transcriptional regulator/tetratricopeptide (TPR) repeat protein
MNQGRVQPSRLLGRRSERETLDGIVTDALAGQSRVIVVRGEAGIGKSALLGHVLEKVAGWHVATAVGVESEMELAYSGLHQLCGPMLDHLDRLPTPQREALATVFGQSSGPAPDRFLVGLAALTLFAEIAEEQPLVCIIDDAQWLDRASAQILGFVARRLLAERIALVCATRSDLGDKALAGLPELSVDGLGDSDARALLLENVYGPLDAAVCEQIVTESHGNPLALLELPRSWRAADLAGGFGLPDSQPVVSKIEQSYVRRLRVLPSETQLLLLAAAAEPLGDPLLLHRAAETLGVDMGAADPAVDAGLLRIGGRVEFAHPLVRSAAYRSAATEDRHRVHRALADATDPETDPDRRAWHRARATPGPGEEVATELERSAGRAGARGGVAASAAFLQRAVALTVDPARRAGRALAAAQASFQAGEFDAALGLLATAEAYPLDGFQSAQAALLRGHIALASAYGNDAAPLLLQAARGLEPFDLELARRAYLTAWGAAITANHLGGAGVLLEICRAVRALPPLPAAPHPLDLVLEGLALLTTDDRAAATPILQRAAKAVLQLPVEDMLRWGWLAPAASSAIWDSEGAIAIYERKVQLVRDTGALGELPIHLHSLALERAWLGDFAGAGLLLAESDSVAAATGSQVPPFAVLRLRALQGREAEATPLIEATIQLGTAGGQGIAVMVAYWAAAVLNNGLARYEEAASAAREVTANAIDPWESMWALAELVEAAARVGDTELARDALNRLAETTQPAGTEFALGIEARSRALLSDGATAEELYRESIDRLSRTQLRPELARAHLLYGEWLRRGGRRFDAREQLRTAHDMFVAIGMEAFAERARRELIATGEKMRKRSDQTRDELTPQEEQIARLARVGLSNPEIGAQLFISARTVEWHLGKVFTKLRISSRRELRAALPEHGGLFASA